MIEALLQEPKASEKRGLKFTRPFDLRDRCRAAYVPFFKQRGATRRTPVATCWMESPTTSSQPRSFASPLCPLRWN